MKNREEFRRTVMEKAARYEAERKNRNRKIRESILLCSICIVIAVSLYVGAIIKSMMPTGGKPAHENYESSNQTYGENASCGSVNETDPTEQMISSSPTEETIFSDSNTASFNTDSSYLETQVTTTTTFFTETVLQTTKLPETPEKSFRMDFCLLSDINETEEVDVRTYSFSCASELSDYLNDLHTQKKIPQNSFQPILAYYTDDYLKYQTLIVVEMKDTVQRSIKEICVLENGVLSLTFRKSKNTGNSSQTNTYYYFITIDKSEVEQIEISIES